MDPRSPRLDSELEELASRLLCRRWHQDQAAAMQRQWRRDIQNHQAVETARQAERSRIVQRRVAPAQTPVARTRMSSMRRELVTTSITTSVTRESSSVTIVSIVIREDSSERATNTLDEEEEEEAEKPRQQTNPESRSSNQPQETTNHQADISPPAPSAVERTGQTTAPSVEVQRTTTREEPQQGPASGIATSAPISSIPAQTRQPQHEDSHPAHHDRRAIEGECPICCEDVLTGGDTTWCRAQCRQNFHVNCIDLWHASQEADEREKTCPYW